MNHMAKTSSSLRVLFIAAILSGFLLSPIGFSETYQMKSMKIEYIDPSESQRREISDSLVRLVGSNSIEILDGQTYIYTSQGREMKSFSDICKKEPGKYKSDDPVKGIILLGAQYFPFVMDTSDLWEKGYETFYFDINGNGDLTDDKPVKAAPFHAEQFSDRRYLRCGFPRIDVELQIDGDEYQYGFFTKVYCYARSSGTVHKRVRTKSAVYREAEIELNGKDHKVQIVDFNSNGRFDDEWHIVNYGGGEQQIVYAQSGDQLLVDPDRYDNKHSGYYPTDHPARLPMADRVAIDKTYYEISLSPSGMNLTLEESKDPVGYVKNPNQNYSALIYRGNEILKISGDANDPVPVPVGQWQLAQYRLDRSKGSRMTFVDARATASYQAVEVGAGKTVEFPFGPPYKAEVTLGSTRMGRGGDDETRYVGLDLSLVGLQGEVCSDAIVSGDRPPNPTFAIATSKGDIVQRGNFEYG